jgi:hypothetical protein
MKVWSKQQAAKEAETVKHLNPKLNRDLVQKQECENATDHVLMLHDACPNARMVNGPKKPDFVRKKQRKENNK